MSSISYKDAGVDIDAGDALVERIKPLAKRTMRPEVLAGIGGFGALIEISKKYQEPVLVSGTDGVGTKLKLAFELNRHDSVGIDLVAMSVNDILVQGAEPLFFLDYFACGKLTLDTAEAVIAGVIGGQSIVPGDVVLGLASSGAHSNGYSLIRKLIDVSGIGLKSDFHGRPFADAVMAPTRIYVKPLLALMEKLTVKGMAHITGGGITGNLPRCLPESVAAKVDANSWTRPPLFDWLQQAGNVEAGEMLRTFNCGIGMCVVVAAADAAAAKAQLEAAGETVWRIGEIVARPAGAEQVIYS